VRPHGRPRAVPAARQRADETDGVEHPIADAHVRRRLSKSGLEDFAVVVVLAYDCAGPGLALAQIGGAP